jgi:hypothetical protein
MTLNQDQCRVPVGTATLRRHAAAKFFMEPLDRVRVSMNERVSDTR